MELAITIVALIAAVASAFAALGSWRSSLRANDTAEGLAAIERERRHSELTPKFDISCSAFGNTNDDATLSVRLIGGPLTLDSVVIAILDETGQDHWGHGLPDGLTQEQADLFVWGPWEFNTGASEQIANYRTTKPKSYSRVTGKDWDRLGLVRTRAGAWMSNLTATQWRAERSGPIRLGFICELAGYEPWHVEYDIPAP